MTIIDPAQAAVIEEVCAVLRAVARLGSLDRRLIIVEPTRRDFFVHLCDNPPADAGHERPVQRYQVGTNTPKVHTTYEGYVMHSEHEWGPLTAKSVQRLYASIKELDQHVACWKAHDTGQHVVVHVKHGATTRAYYWCIKRFEHLTHTFNGIDERELYRRIDRTSR